jgi:hypothetical protein
MIVKLDEGRGDVDVKIARHKFSLSLRPLAPCRSAAWGFLFAAKCVAKQLYVEVCI